MAEQRNVKEELERLVAETEAFRTESAAKLERLRSGRVSPEQARRFNEMRRARLWHMPLLLWLPVVLALIALFVLALYAAGR